MELRVRRAKRQGRRMHETIFQAFDGCCRGLFCSYVNFNVMYYLDFILNSSSVWCLKFVMLYSCVMLVQDGCTGHWMGHECMWNCKKQWPQLKWKSTGWGMNYTSLFESLNTRRSQQWLQVALKIHACWSCCNYFPVLYIQHIISSPHLMQLCSTTWRRTVCSCVPCSDWLFV